MSSPSPSRSRLDRFLAHARDLSRTEAQLLIRRGHVTIDGLLQTNPAAHVIAPATVALDGVVVAPLGQLVFVFHKPTGVVSATRDDRDPTVLDALPRDLSAAARRDLLIVGRLDKDATGLLLLTNDGTLVHRLTHPRHHIPRTYALTWEGTLAPDAAARVQAGLPIDGGDLCLPATFTHDTPQTGTMTLHQGMYHQVKRMIAALGGTVTRLHRVSFGTLVLGDLPAGALRPITPTELSELLAPHDRSEASPLFGDLD